MTTLRSLITISLSADKALYRRATSEGLFCRRPGTQQFDAVPRSGAARMPTGKLRQFHATGVPGSDEIETMAPVAVAALLEGGPLYDRRTVSAAANSFGYRFK